MTRARDLSKLSNSQAFSVDNDFNVGINSSVPTAALDVRGNTVISGVLTATSFSGDGSALTGVANTENVIGTAITMTTGTFTGNVSVGGTLTGNVTGTASLASNLTGSPNISVGTITATGNVSVGGTLTYEDVTNVDSVGVITARSDVSIADKIVHTGDTNTAIRFPAADTFTVETGGSEALRVDSSQRLLKGHTSSESMLYTGGIQVQGTNSSTSAITVKSNQADSGGPALVLGKSRGSLGGTTVVQSGDQLGSIYFNGADGTDTNTAAAEIRGAVDGTPGSNDMPGRLMFFTTADGASSPTERLRVASSGQIGLGGANYGTSGQVITSNGSGSAPTWQNSDSNTLDLVASGAIADGDTVVIRTDGKVGIVTGSSGSESKGSFATAESANSQYVEVTGAGSGEVVMIYNDAGNNNYSTAAVGTISGTSITFGTPVAFNSTDHEAHAITYDANADRVVVMYRAHNLTNKDGQARVGTISGNSISFGTAVTFDNYTGHPSGCFDSDNNKIIICYQDGNNGNYGTAIVGTVSGTSISFGSATVFESDDSEQHSVCYIGGNQIVNAYHNNGDNSKGYAVVGNISGTSISFTSSDSGVKFTDDQDIRNISCVYDEDNDKVVITFTDSSGNRKAVVGTPSGNTISFGSAVTFGQTSSNLTTPHMHAVYNTFVDKVVVAYRDGDNSDKGTVALGTVSGTSISFGTGFVYEADGYTDFNWPANVPGGDQNVFIGYRDQSGSSHARGVVYSAPFSNTNVTAANFIGISDGAYTNGQTAKIRFAGVDDAQVGLTTGSFYYVQGSGDLGTSAGDPSVEAGVAISATEILLKKNQ